MKKALILIALIAGVALAWAAPPDRLPNLLTPPAEARTVVMVGGGPPSTPPGTLLLGNNNTTTSADGYNGNPNTAYYMCQTGQATATATTAYFYDNLGYETDPVHVCVWLSNGTLVACSGNITMTSSVGWRSASISASITQGASYVIGIVSGTSTGFWTRYDESSPSLPCGDADSSGVTFGSEGSITVSTCNLPYGSFTIYITN